MATTNVAAAAPEFPAPATMVLFDTNDLALYTRRYNWRVAMKVFKSTRTWPQVLAAYASQFNLAHLDTWVYTNSGSIRDRFSRERMELVELVVKHDRLAAQLLLNFASGN